MTARPVAPVIPGVSPGRRCRGKPGAGRPMPLARPPDRPDVVYGFGRIDASGRVADRTTIAALGWRGGDRLTLTADAGVMIAPTQPPGHRRPRGPGSQPAASRRARLPDSERARRGAEPDSLPQSIPFSRAPARQGDRAGVKRPQAHPSPAAGHLKS